MVRRTGVGGSPDALSGRARAVTAHLRIPVDDTELDVRDTGRVGDARVAGVFVNGAFSTKRAWGKSIAGLGDPFRCVTYDERGRGKSSPATGDTAMTIAIA